MNWTEILGFTAGTISAVTFLPQVIRTWKLKSARELSLLMICFITSSVSLWIVYGILINNIVIIYTNSIVLILSLFLIYFKYKFRNNIYQ